MSQGSPRGTPLSDYIQAALIRSQNQLDDIVGDIQEMPHSPLRRLEDELDAEVEDDFEDEVTARMNEEEQKRLEELESRVVAVMKTCENL